MTQSDREPGVRSVTFQPGCGMQMFLTGALALAGGIYLMNKWAELGPLPKAGAIVLVVLGTLLVLPKLIIWAAKLFFRYYLGSIAKELDEIPKDLSALGDQILGTSKPLYDKLHTYRAAREDDFENLDRAAYERIQQELASLGFRHLGDVVDETIEEVSHFSTVIRSMSSTDGTTTAGFFHFTEPNMPRNAGGGGRMMLDFGSEFTDGTFLTTANTKGLDLTTPATGIDRRQHPLETSTSDLARLHEVEKQKLLAAKAGAATCVVIHTLDDALESEKRLQMVKNKFRKEIGYIDPEEVRRIAKNQIDVPGDFVSDFAARAADEARKKEQGRS